MMIRQGVEHQLHSQQNDEEQIAIEASTNKDATDPGVSCTEVISMLFGRRTETDHHDDANQAHPIPCSQVSTYISTSLVPVYDQKGYPATRGIAATSLSQYVIYRRIAISPPPNF